MTVASGRSHEIEGRDSEYPLMPDLASPYFHFHHTLHSGLEVLAGLGIAGPRITIRMAGLGWRPDWIVAQEPPPGAPLNPDVIIQLSIAGLGFFHNLPVGMWDRGGGGEVGTEDIVELFDDPFQKARHWIREGARVFDLHPDNYQACGRWIGLFGLQPTDWPKSRWYQLAILLPSLHELAGRQDGVRKCLTRLLDLPLLQIELRQNWVHLTAAEASSLGARSSELGIDLILGDRIEDKRLWNIRIGPVTLDRYFAMQSEENGRLLRQTLGLCVPCDQRAEVSWHVLDSRRAPRLGVLNENACLGINSWMGPADRLGTYGSAGQDSLAAEALGE